jgi:hypothetical protein
LENASPVIEPHNEKPPIENRSEAGSFEESRAKAGPQIMFTKLLIEMMSDRF